MKRKAVLRVVVEFDDEAADADGLAAGLDRLLETYLDHFEDYGPVSFSPVEPETDLYKSPPQNYGAESACAVVGCYNEGKPHVCPYDGTRHGHGRIHYDCHQSKVWCPETKLRFKPDAWRLICDACMAIIRAEIANERAGQCAKSLP